MELCGKSSTFPGSQEVTGSTPVCSTLIIKGLQILEFVTLSFLPVFCQQSQSIDDPKAKIIF
jgi:hypothetical protein